MFDIELMRRASAAVAMTEEEAAAARAYREPDDGAVNEAVVEPHAIPDLTDTEVTGLVSQEAKLLVVEFEVTSQRHYEKNLIVPEWPGKDSGITIGIGYDIGYHTEAELVAHWEGLLATEDIAHLRRGVGKRGQAAKAALHEFATIRVPWDAAMEAFTRSTMPKYGRLVLEAFPNASDLAGHCFGALFSLVFNRGASFSGERRKEMRAIRDLMRSKHFDQIPEQFRLMKAIWKNDNLPGLLKRRDMEALLFERGLELRRTIDVASMSGAVNESLQDESRFDGDGLSFDDTEDVGGATFEKVGSSVAWPASDDDAPDYHHIPAADRTLTGTAFEFSARELELLIAANSFNPTRDLGRIVFALRGAELVSSLTSATVVAKQLDRPALMLRDTRPNHRDLKCVIGVYDTTTGRLSGFSSSTVPNVKAVESYYTNRSSGNMTPTGCYRFEVGWHLASKPERKVPGCLIERGRRKAVLRTTNNLSYDLEDPWHNERDTGNNLHPAFGSPSRKFSSFGCLVVNGTFVASGDRAKGTHKGEWAEFRAALGLAPSGTSDHGKEYDVALLTGLEAAVARRLVKDGQGVESEAARLSLVRLRQGSKGEPVRRLQGHLKVAETGVLDHQTAKALAEWQKANQNGKGDGIYSPALDQHYNLQVLAPAAPVVVAMAKDGAVYEGVTSSGTIDTARLEQLYYEIGFAAEASRRNPGSSGAALESMNGVVLERLSLDLGLAGVRSIGASIVRTVEQQLQQAICGSSLDQAVDRDAIRSKIDAAAEQGVTELRRYLSGLLSTLTLLPPTAADKVVEVLFERFIKPATSGIGGKVSDKMDLSANWLCEQWKKDIDGRGGTAASSAPTQPTQGGVEREPVQAPGSASPTSVGPRSGPVSTISLVPTSERPAPAASSTSVMLDRIQQAADARDVAGARLFIKDLHKQTQGQISPADAERLLKALCDTSLIDQLVGHSGPDPYELIVEVEKLVAAKPVDRKLLKERVGFLHSLLGDARIKLHADAVRRVLEPLKKVKAFEELSLLADRLITRDPKMVGIASTLYAQGLIDSGRIMAGIEVLTRAIATGSMMQKEAAEAYGILGRGYKQRYVDHVKGPADAAALSEDFGPVLAMAVESYAQCWSPAAPADNYYHGINYIALLARAERDGIRVSATKTSADLAGGLIAALEPMADGSDEYWLLATLGEAYLASGNLEKAAEYYGRYAKHDKVDAFALSSTTRQLEQVWQLKATASGPGAIVTGLKSVLATKDQGHVTLLVEERRSIDKAQSIEFQQYFEANLPGGRYISFHMLKRIVECGKAVAAIQEPIGQSARTHGTGFLVSGRELSAQLKEDKSYVLTNAHVLWDNTIDGQSEERALKPDNAQIIFESDLMDGRREVYKCKVVWQSPSHKHDAVLLELDRKVDNIAPVVIAKPNTRLQLAGSESRGTRLAVLGHPNGGNLSLGVHGALDETEGTLLDMGGKASEADPVFLHYKTPTEPGNSGSPVFEATDWQVVALHHAGFRGDGLPRLGNKSGSLKANEGICIQSIRKAVSAHLDGDGPTKRTTSWLRRSKAKA